jgi:hypothetical protein
MRFSRHDRHLKTAMVGRSIFSNHGTNPTPRAKIECAVCRQMVEKVFPSTNGFVCCDCKAAKEAPTHKLNNEHP